MSHLTRQPMSMFQSATMAALGTRPTIVEMRKKACMATSYWWITCHLAQLAHQAPLRLELRWVILYLAECCLGLKHADFSQTGTSTETTGASTTTSGGSKVETIGGQVQTVTVGGSGATAAADTSSTSSKDSGSGLSNGAVAGVAVGSVAGFLAILALILIWYCSKKRQRANSPDPSMQLLDGRNSKGSQMSFMRSVFSDNTTLGGSPTATRNPNATFIDNRMKTNTVLYPNGPRDSSVSLQDNEDYSRPVLRVSI